MKPFAVSSSASVLSPVALQARTTRPLHDFQGQRIACLEGQLWITQHRDPRDIVLSAGQCFEVDRPGLTIVFALKDSLLTVGAASDGAPCVCG